MISSKYVVRAGFLLALLHLTSIAQTTREVPTKKLVQPSVLARSTTRRETRPQS